MTSTRVRIVAALIITLAFVAPLWSILQPVSSASPLPSPTPVGPVSFSPLTVDRTPTGSRNRPLHAPGQFIVKFKATTSAAAMAETVARTSSSAAKHLLLPGYALISFPTDHPTDKDAVVSAAALASLASLRQDPNIELVEPNAYRYVDAILNRLNKPFLNNATPNSAFPNDPGYSYQWHFPQIQAPQAWSLSNGSDIVVAVVDTGVAYENHGIFLQAPDLANTTFVGGWDFVNNDSHPNDDHGHGTHVAGTIAQSTNNGTGVAGIAHGAKIMPIKVLDFAGSGTAADVAQGIVWAADNGAKVINLSLGSSIGSSVELNAINYANSRGVVVVAAAGNSGIGSVGYPAAYPNAIAVGATRYDQARPSYSNYGTELDIAAPGGDCFVDQNLDGYGDGVLQQTLDPGSTSNFGYYFACGTSMATPHVSGVAALLLARNPSMTPNQVRWAMQATATDLGDRGKDKYYGCGLVQAYNALQHALATSSALTSTQAIANFRIALPVVFRSIPTAAPDDCASDS